MSATLLANELSNLVSEAKRKNTDLRNAAEKSLGELKSLPATSEQQLAADLSRRSFFIEPFIIACNTRTAKFAGSGIVSLQRLVISKGLPRSRLQDALEAFNACTDLGLDIQLKILQALPSLLQNYAAELEGDLLSGALQVCSSLQAVKASTVSGVAAATLQQLVTTVFEKVAREDREADSIKPSEEVPGKDGPLKVRPAAFDAYRVLRDLALAAEERVTKFVSFTSLSPESSLELIWSCIDSNPELFQVHEELISIIGSNIIPLVIRALSEKLSFPVTVRSLRLLNLVLDRYLAVFADECEIALNLCTQAIEFDATPGWKRAMVMEILRDFFTENGRVVEAYAAFDGREGGKPIIQDLMSAFVRLSTEKPAAIGLAQQSTIPTGPPSQRDNATDQATLDATGGMAGVFGTALGVIEVSVSGISSQWSLPKIPCMDQLDKSDPPSLPETYIYALVLECFNGLSDGLARIVLPLSVQHERGKSKSASNGGTGTRARSSSFRTRAVPLNPLQAQDSPYAARVQAVAGLVESCWPAVLATSSTYLNAALDDQYFRNLIKAYQRFAQVAGLLRLMTPRDALMTTLAKAAVPPHVLNAAIHEPVKSPKVESPRVFSNPKSLLSMDSLVSPTSPHISEKERRSSLDSAKPMLTVRNLLCLRALLNLAIALGPTLDKSFAVIVSALKQADMVLSSTTPQQLTRQSSFSSSKSLEPQASVVQAFSAEIAAVEAAASRLLESTADYPDDAFQIVLQTFCQLLLRTENDIASPASPQPDVKSASLQAARLPRRTFSGLPGISSLTELQSRDYQFVIPKLGHLAELNVTRFTEDEPTASGWAILVDQLTAIATTNNTARDARRNATNVLVKLAEAMIADVVKEEVDDRTAVQRRTFSALLRLVDGLYEDDKDLTTGDLEIQSQVVDALRVILERCGDSLIAGWDRIIAIICGTFEHEGTPSRGRDDSEVSLDWSKISFEMVSPNIGRTAFAATQLVCSDFLELLPANVLPSLIELLHRFMGQTADVNTSLTTVTMAWNLSDFLFIQCTEEELLNFIEEARESEDLDALLQEQIHASKPAQWFLLLVRLRDVATSHPTKEIRSATFQTVGNVFKNHGTRLSPTAWDLLLRSTLLHISKRDSLLYLQDETERSQNVLPAPDAEMSKTIITGISGVFASHLRLIERISKLPSLWELFLNTLERYLDIESQPLNMEAYAALTKVLTAIETQSGTFKGPAYRTLSLWLKRVPHGKDDKESNQEAYAAYVDAGEQLYRLTRDMSTSQSRTVIDNLWHCTQTANGIVYGGDSHLSSLQSKVMQLLRTMQQDHQADASGLVTIAARLVTLHHDSWQGSGPSGYVALATECLQWLGELVHLHVRQGEVTEAILQALSALQKIITIKYGVKAESKGVPLWRRATSTAVDIAKPVLELTQSRNTDGRTRSEVWSSYVGIVSGIVKANELSVIDDRLKVHEDMLFDMEAFRSLRDIMIPKLGDPNLPHQARMAYCRALLQASIIHETEDAEVPSADQSPLQNINNIRRGRVRKVPYSWREDMSYMCWKELIALSTKSDDTPERKALAEAAAPLLVLRLAVPIRAYIADQPLRGRRPQPRSELEELLFAFENIKGLDLAPGSLIHDCHVGEIAGEQAHVRMLYPLLVQAIGIAGERFSGSKEVLAPLQGVLARVSDMKLPA